jgi:hypothetical protein
MKGYLSIIILASIAFAFGLDLGATSPMMSPDPQPITYVGNYETFGQGNQYLNVRVPIGYSYTITDIFLEDADRIAETIFNGNVGTITAGETAVHIGLYNRTTGISTATGDIRNQIAWCPPMRMVIPQDTTISFFNSGITEYDRIWVTFIATPTDLINRT